MSDELLHRQLEIFSSEAENDYILRIKSRIEELINTDVNLLFSYLYRLDIEEMRIKEIIQRVEPDFFSEALAREIWVRQKERTRQKQAIKVTPIRDKDWEI